MVDRQMHIGLSLSATWLRGSAWRSEDSRVEEMFSPALFVELARRAEAARLDFIFRADTLFLDPQGLGAAPGFSSLDPMVQLAAIAQATSHIGLVTTASTTFTPPFVTARQLQSLHWISNGRAGWNIVTALDGQANFGLDSMPEAEWRYERAAEFTELVRALWRSYPHDALVLDRAAGCFAESDRVAPVDHRSKHFSVAGPLTLPGHPAGPPPLFQAGASETGRDFAASVADAIFASTPDMAAAIALRQELRRRARALGRAENAIRVMPGLALILAETRAEARVMFNALQSRQDVERRYAFIEKSLGLDLRGRSLDSRIDPETISGIAPSVRSRTHAELLLRLIVNDSPTIAELLRRPESSGSAHWQIVGTPADAAETIAEWFAAEALDGVIALPGTMASLGLFLDAVVPALAERGIFRKEYGGATLAHHLGIEGEG